MSHTSPRAPGTTPARTEVRLAEALASPGARPTGALARTLARLAVALARRRVALGFLCSALVLWLAQPSWRTLASGAAVCAVGETLRLWAAGHIEKSREVTSSGPYRLVRHPLYVGSSIIALGIVIVANSLIVTTLVAFYVLGTLLAAVKAEESHLREKFGGQYDAYATRAAPVMQRRFSVSRALSNREHHTIAGLVAALGLLTLKVML